MNVRIVCAHPLKLIHRVPLVNEKNIDLWSHGHEAFRKLSNVG